jgi:putative ABC transport system permease protein
VTLAKPPTLWKYTARQLQRRPGRTLLTLLGIVLGVAASVAVAVTVRATRQAHQDMFEAVTGRAALEVVADGLGGFPSGLARDLGQVAGVRAAVPVIQTPALLVGPRGAVPVLALGVDPARDGAARDYALRQGRLLQTGTDREAREILLEAGFAEANGLHPGEKAELLTVKGRGAVRVVGLLEPRGAATFNGGAVAFLPLPVAQQLFGLAGQVNGVQLVLAEGTDPDAVEREAKGRLPPGLTVQVPSARAVSGRHLIAASEEGLATLGAVSVVAGAFVILNAFLMNLGERRRHLAILRALGATRAQVTRLLLREAVLLGGAGAALGIGLGWVLALSMREVMGEVMTLTLPPLRWSWGPALLGLALGPGIALAATYLPARRAGRRSPLEDLLHRRGIPDEPVRRGPGYVGLALLAAVLVAVLGLAGGWIPAAEAIPFVPPAMALYLVGCALVLPLALGPLLRLARQLVRPVLGLEGGLALRQLQRRPGRTALTAGALLVAVLFAVGFGQAFRNQVRHINDWLARISDSGDFFIRGAWPDATSAVTTAPLPESLADEIRALDPRVERVDRFRFIPARAGGQQVVVLAYTFGADRPPPLPLVAGELEAVREGLQRGEAVVGTLLAQRLGLRVGDPFVLETGRGPHPLRVAGLATEYVGGGMALYLEWDLARRLFDAPGAHTLAVRARLGQAAALGPVLRAFCAERHYLVQSNAEMRAQFDRQSADFQGLVWALVALVFVVASLGVANTLTMNVLEQTRELGALRALGMKRGGVRKLVLAQAVGLGVVSLVPGTAAGVGLTYLMYLCTYPIMGQRIPFQLDPPLVAGCFLMALAIAVSAAYFPARRAARLRVVEALQYE